VGGREGGRKEKCQRDGNHKIKPTTIPFLKSFLDPDFCFGSKLGLAALWQQT